MNIINIEMDMTNHKSQNPLFPKNIVLGDPALKTRYLSFQ